MNEGDAYGVIAYNAFNVASDAKSLTPPWNDLPEHIKEMWNAAGNAVAQAVDPDGSLVP